MTRRDYPKPECFDDYVHAWLVRFAVDGEAVLPQRLSRLFLTRGWAAPVWASHDDIIPAAHRITWKGARVAMGFPVREWARLRRLSFNVQNNDRYWLEAA